MGITQWLAQLNIGRLLELLVTIGASLLCITFHEVSHGFVAMLLGDPTAKRAGRLSLNPLKHLDLVGLVCMALAHFGWAKPVPIDPRYFKNFRRDMALTALAGPVSNFLLAFVFLTIYCALYWLYLYFQWHELLLYAVLFFWYGGVLSIALGIFNLFPIPPLDGSKVLLSFLPPKWYQWVLRYERYGFVLLAVLLYTGLLDTPLNFLRNGLLDLYMKVCTWPANLLSSLFG